jgi:hypothetical protein
MQPSFDCIRRNDNEECGSFRLEDKLCRLLLGSRLYAEGLVVKQLLYTLAYYPHSRGSSLFPLPFRIKRKLCTLFVDHLEFIPDIDQLTYHPPESHLSTTDNNLCHCSSNRLRLYSSSFKKRLDYLNVSHISRFNIHFTLTFLILGLASQLVILTDLVSKLLEFFCR